MYHFHYDYEELQHNTHTTNTLEYIAHACEELENQVEGNFFCNLQEVLVIVCDLPRPVFVSPNLPLSLSNTHSQSSQAGWVSLIRLLIGHKLIVLCSSFVLADTHSFRSDICTVLALQSITMQSNY